MARLLTDGSDDTSFNATGSRVIPILTSTDEAYGMAFDGGKIALAGEVNNTVNFDFGAIRINSDGSTAMGGSLDLSLDVDGRLTTDINGGSTDSGGAVTIDGSFRWVVAGASGNDFGLARYTSSG